LVPKELRHPRPDERHIAIKMPEIWRQLFTPNTISKAIRSKHLLILFSK
jgi:hypothetical protein